MSNPTADPKVPFDSLRFAGTSGATVIAFRGKKKQPQDLGVVSGSVWTCGCGGQDWVLYDNGICLCRGCNCISTVIKCVEDRIL